MNSVERILNIFFVNKCANCKTPTRLALCESCLKSVRILGFGCCVNCGKPVKSCICKKTKPKFTRCISSYSFEDAPISSVIYKLKSKGNRAVVDFLRDSMVKRFLSEYGDIHFDAVTFVPVSRAKLRSKGFDHAELLAKAVAQTLKLKLISPPFKRKKKPAQKYLPMLLRSKNAGNSFFLNGHAVSGNILLVDDVITTGSTLSVCSELLKKAGADKVYCLTAATS